MKVGESAMTTSADVLCGVIISTRSHTQFWKLWAETSFETLAQVILYFTYYIRGSNWS